MALRKEVNWCIVCVKVFYVRQNDVFMSGGRVNVYY